MLTLAFNIQPAKAETLQLELTTDKDVYALGENVTITLLNKGNETVHIGGYPAIQIFSYPDEKLVYPETIVYLAWSLEPGENDTIVWNQFNEFNQSYVEPGTYVIRDTQGWELTAYFEIIDTEIIVPDDYSTIQEAINKANPGDTIYVRAGTYYENVVVNKMVFLIGENRSTTVIDGSGAVNTYVVSILADNVFIGGFTIQGPGPWEGGYWGISLRGNNNTVSKNIIRDLHYGITFYETKYNTIESNMIGPHGHAIELRSSSHNEISNNAITSSSGGIYLDQFNHDILVDNNTITYNHWGIIVQDSWNNVITKNVISTNDVGLQNVYIHPSNPWMPVNSNNSIYHNNFINNTQQIDIYAGTPTDCWHNGYPSGGNYWSDYTGVDADHDGIGDIQYTIDANNTDNYPLMGMFSSFNTTLGQHVNAISNSTIEDFEYFESNSTIKMYVSGEEVFGFCRVSIPHGLMNVSNISVVIDDELTPVLYPNYTLHDNGTHRWIYFAYEHSTHKIDIIPEFPSFLILPLFMIATLLAVIVYKRKHQTRNKKREV